MPPRLRTSPRKAPRQSRSKATVDTLMSAMTRVLIKEGWDAASTNRVAEVAGVSVGSLYQYFPSKEALVLAVMEAHTTALTEQLQQRMFALVDAPLEQATSEVVHLFIENHQLNPKLHKVLIEQVPKVGALGKLEELNRLYEQMVASYLERHRDVLEVTDLSAAAYVVVRAVQALCHHAVLERQDLLHSGKLEEQVVRLVLGFLRPSWVAKGQREKRAGASKRSRRSAYLAP